LKYSQVHKFPLSIRKTQKTGAMCEKYW